MFQPSQLRDRDNKNSHVFVSAGGPLLYENITFVYNSEQLNGTQRVLLDNALSEEQCRELHSVASVRTASLMLSWPGLSSGSALVLATSQEPPEIPLSVGRRTLIVEALSEPLGWVIVVLSRSGHGCWVWKS